MADYIDRDKYCATICRCDKNYCSKTSCYLLRAKAEDVAPVVHGRWDDHHCTACGCQAVTFKSPSGETIHIETPYCPHCGAKMDGDRITWMTMR